MPTITEPSGISWQFVLMGFELFGIVGGIIGIALFIPQIIRSHTTRKTKDLSFLTIILIFMNVSFWAIYGFSIKNLIVFVPNAIATLESLLLFSLKLRYK